MKKSRVAVLIIVVALLCSMAVFANGSAESANSSADSSKVVHVLGSWVSNEGESFEYVLKGFTEKTGIKVEYEGVADSYIVLGTRLASGETPDVCALGNSNGFAGFAHNGNLKSLNFMQDELNKNFADSWITPYTVNGEIQAFPIRCNVQDVLWYNPTIVTDADLSSWDSFIAYLDSQKAEGKTPMAGWYKTTFGTVIIFYDVLNSVATFEQFQSFMMGHVKMTDPIVIEAMKRMSKLINDYVPGGAQGALGTQLSEGFALVFGTNPVSQFVAAGSWGSGIVTGGVNKDAVPGKDLTYVQFPGNNSVETNADIIVMVNDNPEARQLMEYLASVEGASRFSRDGYVVANKNVDPSLYSDPTAQETMKLLKSDCVVPTMVMDNEYTSALYQLIQSAMLTPDDIEVLCEEFESTYGSLRTVL